MKKLLISFLFVLFVGVNQVYAYDLNAMSDDAKLVSALKVLENNGQVNVLERISKSNTKIIFYDLTLISFSYAKHYAVTSDDEYGENYILINSNLMNSPKEALACLIAHESVHELAQPTYEEEIRATITEAKTWALLKDKLVGNFDNDRLVKRLNNLVSLHQKGNSLIAQAILNNDFYKQQLVK